MKIDVIETSEGTEYHCKECSENPEIFNTSMSLLHPIINTIEDEVVGFECPNCKEKIYFKGEPK